MAIANTRSKTLTIITEKSGRKDDGGFVVTVQSTLPDYDQASDEVCGMRAREIALEYAMTQGFRGSLDGLKFVEPYAVDANGEDLMKIAEDGSLPTLAKGTKPKACRADIHLMNTNGIFS